MANNNQKVNVQINLDGKKAEDLVQTMTAQVAKLKNELQAVKDSDLSFDEKAKEVDRLTKELKPLESVLGNTRRAVADVNAIMDDLSGTTLRNLQNALRSVKQDMLGASEDNRRMEELRKQYDAIDGQIQKLRRDYVDVNDVVNNLDIATENMMRKAIGQLRDLRADTLRGTEQWSIYDDQIRKVEKTLNSLNGKQSVNPAGVMSNLSGSSSAEIKESISLMENLRENTVLGSEEWKKYSADIQTARQYLEQFTREQKISVDLARQISEAPGNYSVSEAREAISVLKEYRDTLAVSNTTGLQQVDAQIQAINNSLNITRERLIDTSNILDNPANFSPEQIKQAINEVNKELDKMAMNDPRRDGLRKQVENLNLVLKETKSETVDVQDVLRRLPNASMKELQQAARQLKDEMDALDTTTESYTKKKAEYIDIQNRIEGINQAFKKQGGVVGNITKQIAGYAAGFFALSKITSTISDFTRRNLELSDSLADVQKTSGLTAREVAELSTAIDSIDTRTSQQELLNLAFEAGKLGLSAKEDILGFVKAGNQLVAALGEDLGGADAVKQLMKINDVLGNTTSMGVEKALLATGSAINEIGQSSTANEGYLVDFAQRLGGIAAQSNITMPQLLALGGTTDSLAQNVETSATAMQKFIVTLQTNTDAVAKAAGVSSDSLKEMLQSGKTMEAIITVFEGLGNRGGLAELAPLMGDLGGTGARLTGVLTTVAGNVDVLKRQVEIATVGFEEATSVTQEYNIKNETAAALIERMGNNIRKYFINSGFVEWLRQVLKFIMDLPQWMEKNIFTINGVTASVSALTTALILNHAKLLLFSKGITSWRMAIFAAQVAMVNLRTAVVGLFQVIGKHPIMLVVTAVAALAGGIYKLVTAQTTAEKTQKALNKAHKEFEVEVQKEKLASDSLFAALNKTNEGSRQRISIIKQINEAYGKYLPQLLTEKSSLDEIKKAQELVNEAIRSNLALKMKQTAVEDLVTEELKTQVEAVDDIRKVLSKETGDPAINAAIKEMEEYVGLALKAGRNWEKTAADVQHIIRSKYLQDPGYKKSLEGFYSYVRDYTKSYYNMRYKQQEIDKKFDPFINEATTVSGLDTETGVSTGLDDSTVKYQKEVIAELIAGINDYFSQRDNAIKKSYLNEEISSKELNIQLEKNGRERNLALAELRKALLNEESDFFAQQYDMTAKQQEDLNNISITDEGLRAEQKKLLQDALNSEKDIRVKARQQITDEITKILDSNEIKEDERYRREFLKIKQQQQDIQYLLDEGLQKQVISEETYQQYMEAMRKSFSQSSITALKNQFVAESKLLLQSIEKEEDIAKLELMRIRESELWSEEYWEEKLNDLEQKFAERKLNIFSVQENEELTSFDTSVNKLQEDLENDYLTEEQYKIKLQELEESHQLRIQAIREAGSENLLQQTKQANAAEMRELAKKVKMQETLATGFGQIAGNLASNFGSILGESMNSSEETAAEFNYKMLLMALDTLKQVVQLCIAEVVAREIGTKGFWGIASGAILAGLIEGAFAVVKGSIKKPQAKKSSTNDSTTPAKKLAPGMLTYAEGRYPVLGNDGQTYNAKYESKLETGVYRGGAHYGIFSEKQPEMVIDGPTTQRMMLNHRELYDSIMFLSKNKRLPTYAQGKIPEDSAQDVVQQPNAADITNAVLANIAPVLEAVSNSINELNNQLSRGVQVNTYGPGGLDEALRKRDKFNKTNRLG